MTWADSRCPLVGHVLFLDELGATNWASVRAKPIGVVRVTKTSTLVGALSTPRVAVPGATEYQGVMSVKSSQAAVHELKIGIYSWSRLIRRFA
jgi:hypothetical protein